MNVAVLRGQVSRAPTVRRLPSGDEVVGLEVAVHDDGGAGRSSSVPVSWLGAPPWVSGLLTGTEVVVVGRVSRRFFSSGGVTQSLTDVRAETVIRASQKARVASALGRAQARLSE